MPKFITPSSVEKAIDFWLAARILSAAALIAVVLWPAQSPISPAGRRGYLALVLAYTGCVYGVTLFAPQSLPPMFIQGQGLTPLKVGLEYGIAVTYGMTALVLIVRRPDSWTFQSAPLVAAAITLVASELSFTLYSDASDKYNFMGHVYKVVANYFLYRCIVVQTVRAPFAAREHAHAQIQRQAEIFSTLIENLPVAVSLVNADLRFTAFNRLFLEFFDIPPGGLRIGDPLERFIRYNAERGEYGPGDVSEVVRRRMAMATAPQPRRFERRRPNGRVIENRRVALSSGGFVTTYIDVTDARRREADLEQARAHLEQKTVELATTAQRLDAANSAKSRFLANMSHELRTPLNAILGFSEAMQAALFGPLSTRYQDYARDIYASGTYLLRLINDILDTSKIDVGQLTLQEEDVELSELARECERLIEDRARDGRVELEISLQPGLPPIAADRLRLKQILLNLLSNAVKFTPAGGRVSLAVSQASDDGVLFVVADTGVGMNPADIPLALEPFRQLGNSLSRNHDGAGLGLALSKALVELHGGTLEIESEEGVGTVVRVLLPRRRSGDVKASSGTC
ncbi:MAG: PAS-domain containing protein, partial [Alphaproteobacteria bacterium]|nr:PAS-domain containing protein [Alphaproteobacteria bacterium]